MNVSLSFVDTDDLVLVASVSSLTFVPLLRQDNIDVEGGMAGENHASSGK